LNRPGELWIVAGPNGAGKTTLVQQGPLRELLPNAAFLNPDDHTLAELRRKGYTGFADAPVEILNHTFRQSAEFTFAELEQRLADGDTVCVETVLSTEKYRPIVERVLKAGGTFFLIYVSLRSPALACERILWRVQQGGHDVPAEKVHRRWQRSLGQLGWFATRATRFWVFDNSDSVSGHPPVLLAEGVRGGCTLHHHDFPEVTAALKSGL
jgi:predicted ABC-type ATPase